MYKPNELQVFDMHIKYNILALVRICLPVRCRPVRATDDRKAQVIYTNINRHTQWGFQEHHGRWNYKIFLCVCKTLSNK